MKDRKDIPCLKSDLLIRWANHIAGFYGHPVYLVGSQLYKDNPRDVDVVCIIPNDEFVDRFIFQHDAIGDTVEEKVEQWTLRQINGLYNESNWLWAKDVSHKCLQGMRFTKMQVDLKVLSQFHHDREFSGKPMLKISQD